jgi:hypothetical protein
LDRTEFLAARWVPFFAPFVSPLRMLLAPAVRPRLEQSCPGSRSLWVHVLEVTGRLVGALLGALGALWNTRAGVLSVVGIAAILGLVAGFGAWVAPLAGVWWTSVAVAAMVMLAFATCRIPYVVLRRPAGAPPECGSG